MVTTEVSAPAGSGRAAVLLVLRVLAAASLAAMGVIHLYLYGLGYDSVPLIGLLFLLNGIGSGVLMLAVLFAPRRLLAPAATLSALFTAGTLAALIVSLTVGLFGFLESMSAPLATTTIVVEALGVVLCAALAVLGTGSRGRVRN